MNRRFSIAMLEYQRASIILTASSGHLEAQNVAASDLPRYVQFRDVHGKCLWGELFGENHQQSSIDKLHRNPLKCLSLGQMAEFLTSPTPDDIDS